MGIDNRLLASLEHNLGPVIMSALRDPDVVEIMLNPDGKIWIEKLGHEMEAVSEMATEQARLVLSLVASGLDTVVTPEQPIIEGELPLDGSRFEGLLPPIVSAPSFTIRKKASRVFGLDEYVRAGIMDAALIPTFRDALASRINILVVGGTGSGKTTLVNALILALAALCPADRLLILEDTVELELPGSKVRTRFFSGPRIMWICAAWSRLPCGTGPHGSLSVKFATGQPWTF